jgi:clan AA aspartic protease
MGTFSVSIEISSSAAGRFVKADALVDTGATHTLLPRDLLEDLGVSSIDRVPFQLADDRTVEYEVGEARLRLDGRERTTLVVFGPAGTMPLLGATTLELFNLAVDPVRQKLMPVPGLMK